MIRAFRPLDVVRLLLAGASKGEDLAWPMPRLMVRRASIGYQLALIREGLLPLRQGGTWIWWEGSGFTALASAGALSGPRAWQISRLYLAGQDDAVFLELAEWLTHYVGYRGAERLVLRVPLGSPVEEVARRAGFFPNVRQTLLEGEGTGSVHRPDGTPAFRPVQPHEQFALFQLYCASTPAPVRSALGATFDQWKDSMEPLRGKLEDVCYEQESRICAWLCISRNSGAVQAQLMVHPKAASMLPALLDYSLRVRGKHLWLVPSYQETLVNNLRMRGFKVVGEYSLLVKPEAVKVASPSQAAVEAL